MGDSAVRGKAEGLIDGGAAAVEIGVVILIDGKPDEDGGAGIVPLLHCGLLLRWIL